VFVEQLELFQVQVQWVLMKLLELFQVQVEAAGASKVAGAAWGLVEVLQVLVKWLGLSGGWWRCYRCW
jgi:hypothetical protein